MTKKERYQHYVVSKETGEVQWYFPMEIEVTSEDPAGSEYLKTLKENGCEIGMTRLGFREFMAVFVPVTREKYLSLIKDELNKQDAMKLDGRCRIPAKIGGTKVCPMRIPNPDYVEGGDMPKTIANRCETCPYYRFKSEHTTVTFSCLSTLNEDGEPEPFEPAAPKGYACGRAYDELRDAFMDFAKEKKPGLVDVADLLTLGYIQAEAAKKLDRPVTTVRSQQSVLKSLVLEFLDNVITI